MAGGKICSSLKINFQLYIFKCMASQVCGGLLVCLFFRFFSSFV